MPHCKQCFYCFTLLSVLGVGILRNLIDVKNFSGRSRASSEKSKADASKQRVISSVLTNLKKIQGPGSFSSVGLDPQS